MNSFRIISILNPRRPFLLLLFLVVGFYLQAQDPAEHFESVTIKKPRKNKLVFKFQDPVIKTIAVDVEFRIKSKPEKEPQVGGPGSSDFLKAFFSTSPVAVEVICNPIGKIICDNIDLSWEVPVFCPGVMQTVEETTARDHALRSFTTINWKEGANGFILEKGDTIGHFAIISDPWTNQKVGTFSEMAFQSSRTKGTEAEENIIMKNPPDTYVDYGIIGGSRGQQFVLLFDGKQGKAWLFKSGDLCMVFCTDMDDFRSVKKAYRGAPSMEWKPPNTVSEKHDLMRIAIMSKFITSIISKEYF